MNRSAGRLVVRSRNHQNGGNNDPKAVKAVEQSERDWLVKKENHHHQLHDTGNAKDAAKQPLRHQSPRSGRDRLPPKHPTKFNRSQQGSGTCAEDRRRHGEALKSLAGGTSPQDEQCDQHGTADRELYKRSDKSVAHRTANRSSPSVGL